MKNDEDAEDVLQEGFVLIFSNLHSLKDIDALYGWMKRIMINKALRKLSQQKSKSKDQILDDALLIGDESHIIEHLHAEEILEHIQKLPEGYRTVFNMYVVDGYKHSEIADILHIAEGTSRSQLTKARKLLQQSLSALKSMLI